MPTTSVPKLPLRTRALVLRGASGLALLLALLYAPWARACVPVVAALGLLSLLTVASVLGIADWLWEDGRRTLPAVLHYLCAAILILGWTAVANPQRVYVEGARSEERRVGKECRCRW